MPADRDREKENEEELEEEEENLDEEETDSSDSESEEDEEEIEDEEDEPEDEEEFDDEEDEIEEEVKPRPRRRASARRKSSSARRKSAEDRDEAPRRRSRRRTERTKSTERRRRRRDADDEPRRKSRRRGATSRRRRKERKELDPAVEIKEPETPPVADIDWSDDIEPVWEPGVVLGGGASLAGVAAAFIAILISSQHVPLLSILGLGVVLVAITGGGVGILVRKSWGYILGIGANGLGIGVGLLWTLYSIVSIDLNPIGPLIFVIFSALSILFLYHMRWGPGFLADDRDRIRSLKLRTSKHTTVTGEFALSGSIAAILATVLCSLLLMGAATSERPESLARQFMEGMELETLTSAPERDSLVLARWGNEDYFFLGRVQESRSDEEFHIAYLDGDRAWVRLRDLRRDTLRAEASVHVHVPGNDGWLPALVTQRSGNRLEAEIQGQRVWVPLSNVRVREAH